MGKYEDITRSFYEEYEEPVIEDYIVGFSGLDPDRKIKPEEIDHEKLDGLLGGDFSGRYHLTNDQVRKFTGYQGQIDQEIRERDAAISQLRTDSENAVSTLRTDTDQSIRQLRTDTDNAVSTLRTDTDQSISQLRTDSETAVRNLQAEKNRDIQTLNMDLATTKSTMSNQVSEISARQSAVEATQANISARFDEALEGVTEDSEVIDARVDAENTRHVNLGANIRNLHRRVIEGERTSRERDKAIHEHLQEQADELAVEVLRHTLELDANEERVYEIDERLKDETEYRKSDTRYLTGEIAEEARERFLSDEALNDDMYEEYRIRKRADDELRDDISATREKATSIHEHLQEQADELAGALLTEEFTRRDEIQTLKDIILHWKQKSLEVEEHISEQLAELSLGVIRNAYNVRETDERVLAQQRHVAREISNLREDVDTNAYTLMDLAVQLSRNSTGESAYVNPLDWSKSESLAIPEPRCAVVNISGIDAMPTSKTVELNAVMEFWDLQGNYFSKNITCAAQGNSSMGYVKKNVKFDLLNNNGSEFELKIGDWVAQDGFHLKAYYTDFFRGVAVASYKFWDEVMTHNTERPHVKALYADDVKDLTLQLDTGALCHPDGFPCLVYLNGEFYGIFAWQIKKQRKNYRMDKSTVEHIHIDGTLYTQYFWNGVINWTVFEIRNPNKLYTMDGKKYDGDAPRELIDETSEKYDPDNKDHKRTAKVKRYIQALVQNFSELKTLYTAYTRSRTDGNLAAVKAKYEEIFDWENQRDYLIFSDIIKNSDGFGKNWQWTTYDGVKWYVNAYDLDMSYGGDWQGRYITAPLTDHITTSTAIPTGYIPLLYNTELEARYAELREAGIIDVEHIASKLKDWCGRIGTGNYELEYEKWPNSPCILNYTDSLARVKSWLETEIANMDTVYHYVSQEQQQQQELRQIEEIETQAKIIRQREISQRSEFLYGMINGLQEQINELAYMKLSDIQAKEELEGRLSVMEGEIDAVMSEIDPDGTATDEGADEAITDAMNSEELAEVEPEFEGIADEIFGVNP